MKQKRPVLRPHTVSIRMSVELDELLRKYAKETYRTKSAILHMLVDKHLKELIEKETK